MSRPPKYSSEQVLDHCLHLSNREGIQALTIKAVARSLQAPSGSIYHRFASRDVMVASLWLRCVERFQAGFLEALGNPDPMTAALDASRHTLIWSRENLEDAQFLLVHRRQDLVSDSWPTQIQERSLAQEQHSKKAMDGLCRSLGAMTDSERERVFFAVVTIPLGAVRPRLGLGVAPSERSEVFALEAVEAVLAYFAPQHVPGEPS